MLWVVLIVSVLVTIGIAKVILISRNGEQRPKINCVTCKYCKNETLWSGIYPNGYPNRHPVYCRLQRKKISGGKSARCSLKNPPEEFYEDSNHALYPQEGTTFFFSAYGDCYHSTPHCQSIKGSYHIRRTIFCSDRRPCPKCWEEKDGQLIPRK